ncbi:ABC transporter ATP-binding protein [Sphingobium rhizovicinum]|uniref:ABC transporter ATP-binding protein n=1 Tax=Sphingobium rhizovicinum TaxID=432308 RepID=A0ABV7NFD8_9SPHN
MRQGAIVVSNVGKMYRSRDGGRPTTLKGFLLSGHKSKKPEAYWGLRNISFAVPRGRAVGVIGLNGAGKSTLLRLIGGVGKPDEGSITVHGRIGALLDIGAGLTEDLTGRENVYLLGVIAGMLRSEISEQFDAIVGFAELEEHINAPVRTYSSGMKMRLAFAVAVHTRPEVLLIDEVLAVGDKAFQQKCFDRVEAIRQSGCTIFLVSHDISQIEELCDDALFLKDGHMVAYGPLKETLALYSSTIDAKVAATEHVPPPAPIPTDPGLVHGVNRYGSADMKIQSVQLQDGQGHAIDTLPSGSALQIVFGYERLTRVRNPIALIGIYGDDDVCRYETHSQIANISLSPEGWVQLKMDRLDLAPGNYHLTIGLFSSDWQTVYDYHAEVYPLKVTGIGPSKGALNPPIHWHVQS